MNADPPRPRPKPAATCTICQHPPRLHHHIDGCLVLRCGCWRTY